MYFVFEIDIHCKVYCQCYDCKQLSCNLIKTYSGLDVAKLFCSNCADVILNTLKAYRLLRALHKSFEVINLSQILVGKKL